MTLGIGDGMKDDDDNNNNNRQEKQLPTIN
jgi:hypothetical protein